MQLTKRVNETRLSEGEYRGLKDRLSYSSMKQFDNDRKAFYREMILGESRAEKDTVSKVMGSLVHLYLSDGDFNERFHLLNANEPKGQMKDLVDNLYDRTMRSLEVDEQDNYRSTEKFEVLFMDAVQATKYDQDMKEVAFKGKDMQKIIGMFAESDAEIYYKEKLAATGKSVVSVATITKAEQIVEKLRGHSYTYEYANARTEGDVEVFYELAILFEHEGVPYKSMLDKVIVDRKVKTIQPLDWKTSWNNEEPDYAYLKFGYYLQGTMYDLALNKWKKEHGLDDYTILPMKFIFCDTAGWADPVVLNLTMDDLKRGWNGFSIGRYKYRGLNDLMHDISWHVETGNWATSKATFDKKGEIFLSINYED